jgi:metallo-beta-lactamase family protein
MRITFQGAAREVTGSCHVVAVAGQTILLDAGLFQGRRAEVHAKNLRMPVAVDAIDAVVLSHAHIDHAGRLPYLVRQGYRGPIHATPATRDLCRVMLADSAHIQEKDAEFLARRGREHHEPLYDHGDVDRTIGLMQGTTYGTWFPVASGVRALFLDAGHILGSASIVIEWKERSAVRRLAFSGDIGRRDQAIVRNPVPPEDVDAILMESTYGGRSHPASAEARQALGEIITTTAARGGKVLIPAFAVGRTQEIIYAIHGLLREGRIPEIPVVIDSPLASEATGVFVQHAELFDQTEPLVRAFRDHPAGVLQNHLVSFAQTVDESKEAMNRRGPMVVIAASGMAESGRILHHLLHGASDPKNTILIVGFQAEHTLGRRIVERRPVIKVYGEEIELRAEVRVLNGYSAHADSSGLIAWHEAVRRRSPRHRKTWLVHGEPDSQAALQLALERLGARVSCPAIGTSDTLAA